MPQFLGKLRGGVPREPLQFVDRLGQPAVWLPSGEVRSLTMRERLSQDSVDAFIYAFEGVKKNTAFDFKKWGYDA